MVAFGGQCSVNRGSPSSSSPGGGAARDPGGCSLPEVTAVTDRGGRCQHEWRMTHPHPGLLKLTIGKKCWDGWLALL